MLTTHIAKKCLTMDGIYFAMDHGFAKHPMKHKFRNLC
jgi:hypothetical protein